MPALDGSLGSRIRYRWIDRRLDISVLLSKIEQGLLALAWYHVVLVPKLRTY